jgi:hypothetical protein
LRFAAARVLTNGVATIRGTMADDLNHAEENWAQAVQKLAGFLGHDLVRASLKVTRKVTPTG